MNYEATGQIPIFTEGEFEFDAIFDHASPKIKLISVGGKNEVFKAREIIINNRPNIKFSGFVDRDFDGIFSSQVFPEIKLTSFHDFFSEILLRNKELIRKSIVSNSRKYHKNSKEKESILPPTIDIDSVINTAMLIASTATLFEIYIRIIKMNIKLGEKMIQKVDSPLSVFETFKSYVISGCGDSDHNLEEFHDISDFIEYIENNISSFNFSDIEKYIGDHTLLSCLSKSLQMHGIANPTTTPQSIVSLVDCPHLLNLSVIQEMESFIGVHLLRCERK
ncbi:DUF4435 domain-containing protein [Rothia nasimurium]|uniref:DUF4435 domain-containing protein n=1 Tax=Rothia nasimurium TaxID=85336 RepID=UPI001F30E975|nr:DUF4435 domain-containing protein [Rothia nasimurium]